MALSWSKAVILQPEPPDRCPWNTDGRIADVQTWIDSPEEDHAIVTAEDTSPAPAKAPAVVDWIERRPKAIIDLVVERAIQFASLCRHQGAPDPEVNDLVKLELPDRIDQADVRVTIKLIIITRTTTRDVVLSTTQVTEQLKHSVLNVNLTYLWIPPLI